MIIIIIEVNGHLLRQGEQEHYIITSFLVSLEIFSPIVNIMRKVPLIWHRNELGQEPITGSLQLP